MQQGTGLELLGGGVFFLFAILALISLATTVFWIVELVDVLRRDFRDPNAKIIWILVVLFTHTLGALLYYFIGKQQGTLPGESRI